MVDRPSSTPDLDTLVGMFYPDPAQLGDFDEVPPDEMPPVYRILLDHDDHMTVTVEAFHASRVDVEVLEARVSGTDYSRRIVLRRQRDGAVVQFGIASLDMRYLPPAVCREIKAQEIPLGRILIENQVMRKVELATLWRVVVGPDLARLLRAPPSAITYGRTALIHCDGYPAVELLEIVTPVAPNATMPEPARLPAIPAP